MPMNLTETLTMYLADLDREIARGEGAGEEFAAAVQANPLDAIRWAEGATRQFALSAVAKELRRLAGKVHEDGAALGQSADAVAVKAFAVIKAEIDRNVYRRARDASGRSTSAFTNATQDAMTAAWANAFDALPTEVR